MVIKTLDPDPEPGSDTDAHWPKMLDQDPATEVPQHCV